MANGHYSPDSGPSSHLSVTIIDNCSISHDAALSGAANVGVASIAPELASVASSVSITATSHN